MKKAFQQLCFILLFVSYSYAQEDIRDVVAPVDWPRSWFWMIIVIALLAVGCLLGVYILKRRQKVEVPQEPEDTRKPWEIAHDELKALEKLELISKGMFKEFYFRLSQIIRHYCENRFSIKAPEMTTEEFLASMSQTVSLTTNQKQALKDFMQFSDMVKFAKFQPTAENAQDGFKLAVRLVEETKQQSVEA